MTPTPFTCSTCKFWQARPTGDGVCRRYAPKPTVILHTAGINPGLVWPATRADEWCGEYLPTSPELKAIRDPDREGLA